MYISITKCAILVLSSDTSVIGIKSKTVKIYYIILSFYNLQLSYITRTRIFFAIVQPGLNLGCVYCNSSTYFTNTCV